MHARIGSAFESAYRLGGLAPRLITAAAVLLALAVLPDPASAQRRERLGSEVVSAACASCHAAGTNGAPRIGDEKAWTNRAAQGLSALTEHALKGIRNMPAHGGSPGVSDIEIERAIVTMVNQSGGRWIEPIGGATQAGARSSAQIVQAQCAQCHQAGLNGAPKVGDRAAWVPRLKKGLDALVASAVHGHGAMPSRGGLPDLSDQEIREATVYMFNYGVPMVQAAPTPAAAPADAHHKVVDGTEIYFGMMSADALRAAQKEGKTGVGTLHGGIPRGKGYYHLNISLVDSKTQVPITNAEVKVRVGTPIRAETKPLELVAENNFVSYGQYFQLSSAATHDIAVQIRRPGVPKVIEARFDFKAN